jgi:hypothetical protein
VVIYIKRRKYKKVSIQYKSTRRPLLIDIENFVENDSKFFDPLNPGAGYGGFQGKFFSKHIKYFCNHIEIDILISPGHSKFEYDGFRKKQKVTILSTSSVTPPGFRGSKIFCHF